MNTAQVALVLLQQGVAEVNELEWLEAAEALAMLHQRKMRAVGRWVRTPRQAEQVTAEILDHQPKVIFLAVGHHQSGPAYAMLQALKDLPASCAVVVGGTWGTFLHKDFSLHDRVQAVLFGAWADSLIDFSMHYARHGVAPDVRGAAVRGLEGWILGERRTYNPDLDKRPFPEREDFRIRDLLRVRGGTMPLHASAGFPFRTLFSQAPVLRHLHAADFPYHFRSPTRVVEEAAALREKYPVKVFSFVDELFPWMDDWVTEFAERWATEISLPFRIRSVAEYVREETLRPLRKAKLQRVEIGLETGAEALRQQVADLNQTNQRVLDAFDLLRDQGVAPVLRLLTGIPGETFESLRKTVDFARDAQAARTIGQLYEPWPDSAAFRTLEKKYAEAVTAPVAPEVDEQVRRDALVALDDLVMIDSLHRANIHVRREGLALDGVADFPTSVVRSPYEGAARIQRFHTSGGSHDVVALRVPAEVSWEVRFPKHPTLDFGILLEPHLPGERCRVPITFSVRVSQRRRVFRIFKKILIQALDPDSRRWHWFHIPVSGVKPGPGRVIIENLVAEKDAKTLPEEEDVWAGWARLYVRSEARLRHEEEERTDHSFEAVREDEGRFGDQTD